jgi:hypothetical protein
MMGLKRGSNRDGTEVKANVSASACNFKKSGNVGSSGRKYRGSSMDSKEQL